MPPEASGRDDSGNVNGPKFWRCWGAKFSGVAPEFDGAPPGACERGCTGGTNGVGPAGPPTDVDPTAPGIAMPGKSCDGSEPSPPDVEAGPPCSRGGNCSGSN